MGCDRVVMPLKKRKRRFNFPQYSRALWSIKSQKRVLWPLRGDSIRRLSPRSRKDVLAGDIGRRHLPGIRLARMPRWDKGENRLLLIK